MANSGSIPASKSNFTISRFFLAIARCSPKPCQLSRITSKLGRPKQIGQLQIVSNKACYLERLRGLEDGKQHLYGHDRLPASKHVVQPRNQIDREDHPLHPRAV